MLGVRYVEPTLFIRYGIVNSNILHYNSTMDCILSPINVYGASTLHFGMHLTLTTQRCVWFFLGTYAVRDSSV